MDEVKKLDNLYNKVILYLHLHFTIYLKIYSREIKS